MRIKHIDIIRNIRALTFEYIKFHTTNVFKNSKNRQFVVKFGLFLHTKNKSTMRCFLSSAGIEFNN